jgi:hypothetical protein
MHQTIGDRLDVPGGLFHWLDHAGHSLAVVKLAAETKLCHHLADGPVTIAELAIRCGLPADKLRRLVYFLAAEQVLELLPDGRVAGTPRSERLRQEGSVTLIASRSCEVGPFLREACVRGVSAYEAHFGKPVFAHFPEDPTVAAAFVELMGIFTRRIEEFISTHHEFRPFERAVDVGGSHGGLLMAVLAKHPQAKGVLFDLPETVTHVASTVRTSEHGKRIELIGGDFFEAVPAGDLYLIKMILHDWNDDECIAILKSVRAAIAPGGRVAVIDYLLPEVPAPTGAHLMDIAMMIWATGRERRLSEFEGLFARSGFRLDRVTENPEGQSVVEAVPV